MFGNRENSAQYPIFVYGTLRRGEHNHDILKNRMLMLENACATDMALYSLGAYPMMIRANGIVRGELIFLQPFLYDDILRTLDQLEGYRPDSDEYGLYRRELIPIESNHYNRTLLAWAYVGNKKSVYEFCPHIVDGDWVKYRYDLIRETRFGRFMLENNH